MALSKALQKCSLGRFDGEECSNFFSSAKDMGFADTLVQINPGPGTRDTYRFHRILLGLNRANPLLLMTSEEAANFYVCRNHKELCMDPSKASTGKVKCGGCKKATGTRIATLKTSISLTITMNSPVTLGEWICSKCATIRLENEGELIAFLNKEHSLAMRAKTQDVDDVISLVSSPKVELLAGDYRTITLN